MTILTYKDFLNEKINITPIDLQKLKTDYFVKNALLFGDAFITKNGMFMVYVPASDLNILEHTFLEYIKESGFVCVVNSYHINLKSVGFTNINQYTQDLYHKTYNDSNCIAQYENRFEFTTDMCKDRKTFVQAVEKFQEENKDKIVER